MTTAQFLGLERRNETQWSMAVGPHIIGGSRGALFGGAGLAAAVLALEGTSGRPPVWVSAQYSSSAVPPAVIDFDVTLTKVSRKITQARVTGRHGDEEMLTALGALGQRTEEIRGEWETFPDCPSPENSEEVIRDFGMGENVHKHTDARMARGMFGFTGTGSPSGDNRSLVWTRLRDTRLDEAALALLADYMASSFGNAVGQLLSCTSLDNTIRFANPIPQSETDSWVLCDNRVGFVGNGFGNGTCLMWSQSGQLLATASQTMIVRLQKP